MRSEPETFLYETDNPEVATAIRHALTSAAIPYRTGLETGAQGCVVFFVAFRKLELAREIVESIGTDGNRAPDFDELVGDERASKRVAAPAVPFPWAPVQAVASMVLMP